MGICGNNACSAGDHGPAWLEYTYVDEEGEVTALAEAAAQLERAGLVVRRKRMFTAMQARRWAALEIQVGEWVGVGVCRCDCELGVGVRAWVGGCGWVRELGCVVVGVGEGMSGGRVRGA